jgi:uncharacterized membrane protein YeaQ/YmgE (transglycosylase-associated protein family)
MSIIVLLLVGLVAGWLASLIMKSGFGLLGDMVVGVIGAFVGGWVFGKLGISAGGGMIGQIITATIGAVILLFLLRLIRRA